jgi:hypothetical protein
VEGKSCLQKSCKEFVKPAGQTAGLKGFQFLGKLPRNWKNPQPFRELRGSPSFLSKLETDKYLYGSIGRGKTEKPNDLLSEALM